MKQIRFVNMSAIHAFLDFLKLEKRYSLHTLTAYSEDLRQASEWLSSEFEVSDLLAARPQQVRAWVVSLMEIPLQPKSINRKISSLRSFYKYCRKKELISISPMFKVVSPKVPKKLPVYAEEQDMNMLLDGITYPEGEKGLRDRLILEMLYHTGMRRSELLGLHWKDIDLPRLQMKVLGKGNKERLIPISPALQQSIGSFFGSLQNPSSASKVFLNDSGSPLQPRQLYSIVHFYLSSVKTLSRKSPHVLRHTFATHMVNRGADLNAVKEILGHASLAATQVYTHNSIDKLREIHRQAHPKG